MITHEELAELRRLARSAPAGPWLPDIDDPGGDGAFWTGKLMLADGRALGDCDEPAQVAAARLIAALLGAAPALIQAAERVAELEAFLEEHGSTIRSWLCPTGERGNEKEDAEIVSCLNALERLVMR